MSNHALLAAAGGSLEWPSWSDPTTGNTSFTEATLGAMTGMTFDSTHIWMCQAGTADIIRRYTTAGTLVTSFASPGTSIAGLTYDGTNLISGDSGTNDVSVHVGKTVTVGQTISMSSIVGGSSIRSLAYTGRDLLMLSVAGNVHVMVGISNTLRYTFAAPDGASTGGIAYVNGNLVASNTSGVIKICDRLSGDVDSSFTAYGATAPNPGAGAAPIAFAGTNLLTYDDTVATYRVFIHNGLTTYG